MNNKNIGMAIIAALLVSGCAATDQIKLFNKEEWVKLYPSLADKKPEDAMPDKATCDAEMAGMTDMFNKVASIYDKATAEAKAGKMEQALKTVDLANYPELVAYKGPQEGITAKCEYRTTTRSMLNSRQFKSYTPGESVVTTLSYPTDHSDPAIREYFVAMKAAAVAKDSFSAVSYDPKVSVAACNKLYAGYARAMELTNAQIRKAYKYQANGDTWSARAIIGNAFDHQRAMYNDSIVNSGVTYSKCNNVPGVNKSRFQKAKADQESTNFRVSAIMGDR